MKLGVVRLGADRDASGNGGAHGCGKMGDVLGVVVMGVRTKCEKGEDADEYENGMLVYLFEVAMLSLS